MMTWTSHAEVFNYHVAKGEDHSSAALRADEWLKRDRQKKGLCINCGTPQVTRIALANSRLRARAVVLEGALADYMMCHPPVTGSQRAVAHKARAMLAKEPG